MEKLALSFIITARKLRPYFLSHPIIILTNSVLGRIVSHPDTFGRLIKWVTELSEYDIRFEPQTAIKEQALADSLAETVRVEQEEQWKIFIDGSSCQTGSGVGIVMISPWGEEIKIVVRLEFRASNNEAEYEAMLLGFRAAREMGIWRVILYSDSQLAVQQSNGNFEVKNDRMVKYAQAMEKAKETFAELILERISRAENGKADQLAKMASALTRYVDQEVIGQELVSQIEHFSQEYMTIQQGDWRCDLYQYLKHGTIPEEQRKAREIIIQ